jgi:sortase A
MIRNSSSVPAFSKRLEVFLWALGLLCALLFVGTQVQAYSAGRKAEAISPSKTDTRQASGADASVKSVGGSEVIGRLEIPQIDLSVPIMSNFESASLLKGIGHITGTAMPGGLGTLGLAGHRDTYFRPLRKIANKMEIRVTDTTGVYHYQVDSTEIVTPEQVQVLEIQSRPEMTLITCYPFDYIGAAPKRFIVHAHLMSVAADLKR